MRLTKVIIILTLIVIISNGCINKDVDETAISEELIELNNKVDTLTKENESNEWIINDYSELISQLEEDINEFESNEILHDDKEEINNKLYKYFIQDSSLIPNIIMIEIDDYVVGDMNEITVKELDDIPIKYESEETIENITIEKLNVKPINTLNNIFIDGYQIYSPRIIKNNSIVYFLEDINQDNILYLCKSNIDTGNKELIYTLKLNEEFSCEIKINNNYIIYMINEDVIIYDINLNAVTKHYRYLNNIIKEFDVACNGNYISFIGKYGVDENGMGKSGLIVSDIELKQPKLIAKSYIDNENETECMGPRYPSFSENVPNLLSFPIIGWEWSNGEVIYNILDNTYQKVSDGDAHITWIADDLLLKSDGYEFYEIYGVVMNGKNYYRLDELYHQYYEIEGINIIYNSYGIPLYDKELKLTFVNINNMIKYEIEDLASKEVIISLSNDGKYLMTCRNIYNIDREYKLYEIIQG